MTWMMLPKVGNHGIALPQRLHTSDWEFHYSVAKYMRKNNIKETWFQCFNETGWVWFHGIVELQNGIAKITQIG